MGISTDHPDYATPEKYLQTAKNILKYQGYERLVKRGADEVGGMLNRHISKLEGGAERTAAHEAQESPAQEAKEHDEKDEQPVVVQEAKVDAEYRIPQRPTYPAPNSMTTADLQKIIESREAYTEDFIGDLKAGDKTELVWSSGKKQEITIKAPAAAPAPEVAHLITQVEEAATGILTHEAMQPHRAEIEQMIRELHQYPSAGHAKTIVERLKDMGEEAAEQLHP